jgi:iron(III) transport system permease protein
MPIALLLFSSLSEEAIWQSPSFGLANFRNVLNHPQFAKAAANTVLLCAGSVLVMLLFAVPFAWIYSKTDLPRKGALLALVVSNVAIPGFAAAMGYALLLNPSNGLLNQLLVQLFGDGAWRADVYSLGWMAFLQGLALVPPAFFMLVPTIQAIDVTLEEAAATSGVARATSLFRIVLPLVAPTILAAAIYYAIIAAETFDYASVLGFPVRIYVVSTLLYQLMYPGSDLPRYGDAAALGVLTASVALVLGVAFIWATRKAARYVVLTGKRRQQRLTELGRRGKSMAWLFILAYVFLALVLPLLMLVWGSLVPYLQVPSMAAIRSMSLDAYREAWEQLPSLALNNLIAVLTVPTAAVAVAACMAWVTTRSRSSWRRILDVFVMCAIAVPSIVSALAYLYFGLATYRFIPIYGTITLIVVAMAMRFLTWAHRSLANAMMQVHPELEEACAASGIPRGRTVLSVSLPVVKPALVFAWFWIAILSLRELTIPVMLARPNAQTISTAIWGFNVAGNADIASAMSVLLVALIAAALLAFNGLFRRLAI